MNVIDLFKRIQQAAIDLVAPPMCAHCKIYINERVIFCDRCRALIAPIVSITIPVTAKLQVKVFAVSAYQEPIKSLILAKGWSDRCSCRLLGQLICTMPYMDNLAIDYLVPIPLHWTRFAKRGFNQAEEMAKIIAKHSQKPVVPLIKRCRQTKFQSELSSAQRHTNVSEAFMINAKNPELYNGKHLVLIDDLMTTGSTLSCAAKELAKLKPASITALVACRVV
ncbi:MAG TPA: phosphoribosyltransferase family protein [Candidatus Babeliales bacterium]|nr:phosphoribosyltransferase family protein [Candidatus Babeliales bacterium]